MAVAATAVAAIGGSWWVGSELLRPAQHRVPLPADFAARALTIPGSGRSIAAWWLDQGERAPAVLLLHSIRADRSSMLSRARLLVRHGFSVLLIDLQGHGETPGSAITLGWRESADARSALAWLRQQRPARRVGVIGCSLGGAAVLLGPQPAGVDAAVFEAVYPRVGRAIENRIRLRVGGLRRCSPRSCSSSSVHDWTSPRASFSPSCPSVGSGLRFLSWPDPTTGTLHSRSRRSCSGRPLSQRSCG
jgi:pimeloyl-ACP methyl ester carboxylesterase